MDVERMAHLDGYLVFADAGEIGLARRSSVGIVYADGAVQVAWPSDGSRPKWFRERAMDMLWRERGILIENGKVLAPTPDPAAFRLRLQHARQHRESVQDAHRIVLLVERGWTQWGPHPDYWLKDDGPLRSLQEAYWEEVTG